jgi:hypothetical protein
LPTTLGSWEQVDEMTASGEYWELLNQSPFARRTPLLGQFATEIGLARRADPLGTIRELTTQIYEQFEYSPRSKHVAPPSTRRSGLAAAFVRTLRTS